ncbi:hypothetical protein Tco_1421735 [Tanacetum coccineum]
MTKIDGKDSVESLYLEADLGCSTVNNHDEGVDFGNIKERNGRNSDGGNSAYKVFDEMSSIQFIKHDGSVREYYDAFVSFANRVGWDDFCSVSMFIWGLQPEIEEKVRIFNPKTLYDAYCLAIMQESTNKLLGQNCSKNVDLNSVGLDVVGCLRRDGNKIVINKDENEVKQDSSVSDVSVAANDFDGSIVTDSDIRKQNVDSRKGIKDDEVVESKDLGEVNDNKRVVFMDEAKRLVKPTSPLKSNEMSDGFDRKLDEVNVSSNDTQLRATGSMEQFVKNSVKKKGYDGVAVKFSVMDIMNVVDISNKEGLEDNGKQGGSKDYNKLVGSHLMLGKNKEGSWWLYHIKDPCDELTYGAMNLGTSLLESICIKPQTCWCAACIKKGNKCLVINNEPRVSNECGKVKTTPPLKFDKKLAGFDEMQEPVVMKTWNTEVAKINEGILGHLKFDVWKWPKRRRKGSKC